MVLVHKAYLLQKNLTIYKVKLWTTSFLLWIGVLVSLEFGSTDSTYKITSFPIKISRISFFVRMKVNSLLSTLSYKLYTQVIKLTNTVLTLTKYNRLKQNSYSYPLLPSIKLEYVYHTCPAWTLTSEIGGKCMRPEETFAGKIWQLSSMCFANSSKEEL